MKFCPECGKKLVQPNPKFCPNCGGTIKAKRAFSQKAEAQPNVPPEKPQIVPRAALQKQKKKLEQQYDLRKAILDVKKIQISSKYLPFEVKFCDECKESIAVDAIICATCAVAYYCSTECALTADAQHLIECRGYGPETGHDLFKYPGLETSASIQQSLTLENGHKYLEFVFTSEGQMDEVESVNEQRCIQLFSSPTTSSPPASINFLSIDINPHQIGPSVGADALMEYTLFRRADGIQSLTTISTSLDGPVSIDYFQDIPEKILELCAGESILLGMDPGIETYTITVQVALDEPDGHLW